MPACRRGLHIACRLGTIVLALVLATLGRAGAQEMEVSAEGLADLNAAVRAIYGERRSAAVEGTSPFVIVAFDELHLFRRGTHTIVNFTPDAYHHFKAVAHLPLGVFAAALPLLTSEDPSSQGNLDLLREEAIEILPRLADVGFHGDALSRQRRIVQLSLEFIDAAEARVSNGGLREVDLVAYCRTIAPLLLANANDAARVQLDGLHEAFATWRAELSDDEWNRLYVIVLGAKMPREGNLQFEYFAFAMGRDEIGRRLLYGEGIFEVERARQLLGTIVLDRQVAQFFFNDPMRMDRDILADGARAHLLEMFGRLGTD